MKPTGVIALAALAGPAAAQSLNVVDSFMRDLSLSFRALAGSHPRRAFHRRAPGQLVKRCIHPGNGYPGGDNSTSTTGMSRTISATITSTGTRSSTSMRTATSSAATPSSTWKLQQTMAGSNFFDQWDFWTVADPTNGAVDYQSRENAQANGLIEINSVGNAIMRIENTTQVAGNRKSVRISSKYIMNGGLAILDAVHMPYGCGTWPAWWTTDVPNWPNNGEIDIVEGVNGYVRNHVALHTASGCTIPNEFGASATLVSSTNCAAYETSNLGCGQLTTLSNTYGKPFNDNGGGVYAMLWQSTGISVYFFPRDTIPSDITSEAPQPSTWGIPIANFPNTSCDPATYMKNHQIIFTSTLCGDWAGSSGAWMTAGLGGQIDSCSASTGVGSCVDFIRNNGATFTDAYWEVKSVKVYTT
ncbi:unnamed protein product [Rhizoctonia solani]|uniref:GH16 domain-containing protein n=1 Tax=Rhizoctonia solani TaxID=456999 RepID=A0A8H3GMV3_9AGAM|nr:unnamed protein product [Rhizoctonia solani]